jgi:hypothetical protein
MDNKGANSELELRKEQRRSSYVKENAFFLYIKAQKLCKI